MFSFKSSLHLFTVPFPFLHLKCASHHRDVTIPVGYSSLSHSAIVIASERLLHTQASPEAKCSMRLAKACRPRAGASHSFFRTLNGTSNMRPFYSLFLLTSWHKFATAFVTVHHHSQRLIHTPSRRILKSSLLPDELETANRNFITNIIEDDIKQNKVRISHHPRYNTSVCIWCWPFFTVPVKYMNVASLADTRKYFLEDN